MARVVGLDPGFASCGYAVVELGSESESVLSMGVVRTEKSAAKREVRAADDTWRRGRELAAALLPVIDGADVVCFEAPSLPRNASSSFKIGVCYGVLACIVEAAAIPAVMVSPKELKKAVTGSATATKAEVGESIDQRFSRSFGPELIKHGVPRTRHEHAYDAVGAVVASLDSEVMRMARRM